MISALLLPLVLAGSPADSALSAAASPSDDPPIQLWINNDRRFLPGDRAKVQVRAEEDGYLIVLHADPDGYLRVLFPLDPRDDSFVRGGKKYEVRGRGGRESFNVDVSTGRGTVYAAVSRSPFRFDEFVLGDHWDYRTMTPDRLPREPETELTELVRRMAQGSFDYDLLTYDVIERVVYASDYSYSRPYYGSTYYDGYRCGGYYGCGSGFSIGLFFGRPYGGHFYSPFSYGYNPFYDPFFYDPFYYRPIYYRPFYHSPYAYYPRRFSSYPYAHGYFDRPRGYDYRPYTPYRFRGIDGVGSDYRERRFSMGRAVNTVYTPPRTRFTESPTASPLRQTERRGFAPDPKEARHEVTAREPVLKRRVPQGERRDAVERREPSAGRPLIEARRARPAEGERPTRSGSPERRALPGEIRPESRGADRPQVERAPVRERREQPEGRSARRSEDRPQAEPSRAPSRAERGGGGWSGDRGGSGGGDRGARGGGGWSDGGRGSGGGGGDRGGARGGGGGGGGGRPSSGGGARRH